MQDNDWLEMLLGDNLSLASEKDLHAKILSISKGVLNNLTEMNQLVFIRI